MRIATFGLRSVPPTDGSGGADTFVTELYARLAERGHTVTVYCRRYDRGAGSPMEEYRNIRLVHLGTTPRSGFDSLLHSFRSAMHIVVHNTADVVHIQNGGNSIWAIPLRLFGKRVFISQDGFDWKRGKWKWYARLYLRLSVYVLAYAPATIIVDNIYARAFLEKKFRRASHFVPYGADFSEPASLDALGTYGLKPKSFFLFIGRFIPDKGIHYLIEAFEKLQTDKQLVIIGGSPNPGSEYERRIRSTPDRRILFPGYVYGERMLELLKGCYCYIQPSDIEGLSPMLLTAMGMGVPIICSSLQENTYAVGETALVFEKSNVESLRRTMEQALAAPSVVQELGTAGRKRARELFSWERITDTYENLFSRKDVRFVPRAYGRQAVNA